MKFNTWYCVHFADISTLVNVVTLTVRTNKHMTFAISIHS